MTIRNIFTVAAAFVVLLGCSIQKTATKGALSNIEKFVQDTLFKNAHVGFVLLDEKSGKYIEEYNADKYFVPASITKLFTTHASLKYLKDSLPGFYYRETKDTLYLKPNADPTFLNKDFKEQKVFNKILTTTKTVVIERVSSAQLARFGNGWSWISYQSNGVPERTVMPIYANEVKFSLNGNNVIADPKYFQNSISVSGNINGKRVNVNRSMDNNTFTASAANSNTLVRPFTHKSDQDLAYKLLQDTLASLNKRIEIIQTQKRNKDFWKPFYTYKTEDVVRPMLHQSNNFLAEQLLIMSGTQINGTLNERPAINDITNKDLAALSTKFMWYDASGLSRLNNVTPRAMSDLLVKMKNEFGWGKMASVLQKGNQGTVKGYYKGYEDNIYSKTGTLGSSVVSLSGYLITKKGNNYIFSFHVNNHFKKVGDVRKAFESYLVNIIENQ